MTNILYLKEMGDDITHFFKKLPVINRVYFLNFIANVMVNLRLS
jgi:hypothetical protein